MGALNDALTAALLGRVDRDTPPDPGDVFASPAPNAAIARMMNRLEPGAKLPRKGTKKRTQYEADLRRIQRYRAGEGRQQRGRARADKAFLRRVSRVADPKQRARKAARNGITIQTRAWLKVSALWRAHTMPAGGPIEIDGDALGPALDVWAAGGDAEAELAAAFLDAYDLPGAELRDHEWVSLEIQ